MRTSQPRTLLPIGATEHQLTTPDGRVRGSLCSDPTKDDPALPLLVCVHGSGSNSRYFDLSSNSLVSEATRRGHQVLLVDRPGHGASPAPDPGSAIDQGVAAVSSLIKTLQEDQPVLADRRLALIGHSFGGAVALAYAAGAASGAMAALCVSGIGDRPEKEYAATRTASPDGQLARPAAYWLFGPGSSYDWRGVSALRPATSAWRAEEVHEIVHDWPRRWMTVANAITCPVQVRLAEYERIWETTPAAIRRISSAFTRAARVDAAIAPAGGHLYEAHLRGPELVAAQLDFIRSAVAAKP